MNFKLHEFFDEIINMLSYFVYTFFFVQTIL